MVRADGEGCRVFVKRGMCVGFVAKELGYALSSLETEGLLGATSFESLNPTAADVGFLVVRWCRHVRDSSVAIGCGVEFFCRVCC